METSLRKGSHPSMEALKAIDLLKANMEKAIIGKPDVIRLAIICLISKGHLLIEDVPGVGKTTLAHALATSLDGSLKRIQFTIDLLPSDVIGVSIFNPQTKEFEFKPGPIFTNILLADEINRTTPKTQSSLLEAMNESQVTVDNFTHKLPKPFIVLATQNPIEYHGTYPLPESQLDRFFMRLRIGYPSKEDERTILKTGGGALRNKNLKPVVKTEDIVFFQDLAEEVRVDPALEEYILNIVDATRNHRAVELGVSPRGALFLYKAAQASAFLDGRSYIIADDIKSLALPVLAHRLLLKSRLGNGANPRIQAETVIDEILSGIPVPL